MSRTHWVGRGTETPKDKDKVNKWEVCECEGWVWDLDEIGTPSKLIFIRMAAALTRASPNLYMNVGVMKDYKVRDLRASHT